MSKPVLGETDLVSGLITEAARITRDATASGQLNPGLSDELVTQANEWNCADGQEGCTLERALSAVHRLRAGYGRLVSAGPSLGPIPYGCTGLGSLLSVVFVNLEGGGLGKGLASLRWGDRWLALTQARSASGARYTDSAEQNLFWITGKTARFEVLGEYARDCAVID